jgi:hypothetical protein
MRRISFLLALLILVVTAFAGCREPADTEKETTTPSPVGTTEAPPESEESTEPYSVTHSLPELDFGGQTISILNWKEALCPEFGAEITGDIIGDAVYTRNSTTQDRLGVKLLFNDIAGNNANMENYIQTAAADIMSGAAQYDIFASYSMCGATLATNGYTLDLLSQEHLDFEKPWWPENLIGQATINNKLYFCSGDISTNLLYYMFVMFFNRDTVDARGLENPYELVGSGKWTIDKMIKLTAGMYEDKNGNGARDEADGFGVVAVTNVWSDSFFFASGLSTIEQDGGGRLVISDTWCSEKSQTLLTKLCAYFTDGDGFLGSGASSRNFFRSGNSLIIIDSAGSAKDEYTSSSVNFGVVPVPKYDELQEKYYTTLGFTYTMYSLSKATSSNADAATATLECLASEGYRTTTPEIFEKAFKYKYSSGEENIAMWDIIKSSVSFDLGRIFATSMGKLTYSLFRNALTNNQASSWFSTFAANEKALNAYLKTIMQSFES